MNAADRERAIPTPYGKFISPGGIVKAEGLGDGLRQSGEDHRQASLDDATRTVAIRRGRLK